MSSSPPLFCTFSVLGDSKSVRRLILPQSYSSLIALLRSEFQFPASDSLRLTLGLANELLIDENAFDEIKNSKKNNLRDFIYIKREKNPNQSENQNGQQNQNQNQNSTSLKRNRSQSQSQAASKDSQQPILVGVADHPVLRGRMKLAASDSATSAAPLIPPIPEFPRSISLSDSNLIDSRDQNSSSPRYFNNFPFDFSFRFSDFSSIRLSLPPTEIRAVATNNNNTDSKVIPFLHPAFQFQADSSNSGTLFNPFHSYLLQEFEPQLIFHFDPSNGDHNHCQRRLQAFLRGRQLLADHSVFTDFAAYLMVGKDRLMIFIIKPGKIQEYALQRYWAPLKSQRLHLTIELDCFFNHQIGNEILVHDEGIQFVPELIVTSGSVERHLMHRVGLREFLFRIAEIFEINIISTQSQRYCESLIKASEILRECKDKKVFREILSSRSLINGIKFDETVKESYLKDSRMIQPFWSVQKLQNSAVIVDFDQSLWPEKDRERIIKLEAGSLIDFSDYLSMIHHSWWSRVSELESDADRPLAREQAIREVSIENILNATKKNKGIASEQSHIQSQIQGQPNQSQSQHQQQNQNQQRLQQQYQYHTQTQPQTRHQQQIPTHYQTHPHSQQQPHSHPQYQIQVQNYQPTHTHTQIPTHPHTYIHNQIAIPTNLPQPIRSHQDAVAKAIGQFYPPGNTSGNLMQNMNTNMNNSTLPNNLSFSHPLSLHPAANQNYSFRSVK